MPVRAFSLLALSLSLFAVASCADPTPQACVESDSLLTCGCASPEPGISSYLDPGYHYTSTCSPATLEAGPDVGCCATYDYPANGQCTCSPDRPPGACELMSYDPTDPQAPRPIASCAIDGLLTSQ